METANNDSELRTRADLDAWVERETPELAPQTRQLEPSDERAYIEWCLTVLLTGRTPAWANPCGGTAVSGHEYVSAMRWLRERWPYLRTPLSKKALRAYNSPQGNGFRQLSHAKAELASSLASWPKKGRPPQHLLGSPRVIVPQPDGGTWISWVKDEIGYATAFVAALKESHRRQESFRFTIPEELQAAIGRERLEHPPCVPAEALPLILQWGMWMRARLANEYLDALIPGFKGQKNERRALKQHRETLDKRGTRAGGGRKRTYQDGDGSPTGGLSPAPAREWEDPTFDAVAVRLENESPFGELGPLLRQLRPVDAGLVWRYLDARQGGVTDRALALEEGLSYAALRKRMQRIRERLLQVSQIGQIVEVLGAQTEKENDLNTARLAQQNEVLMDVRDRLDALLVGLEDTVSVLVWKFPDREAEIRGKAGEIFAALSTSNPDMEGNVA